MNNIDCNTTSANITHFLAGVELVKKARIDFNIASENWPYPTRHQFGMHDDKYYAEVWVDGMDWQHTYWIIESCNYSNPFINPLIQFESHEEENKFNEWEFSELLKGIMWFRREEMWIESFDYGRFNDTIWPYVHVGEPDSRYTFFKNCYIEHASQQRVHFLIIESYIRR